MGKAGGEVQQFSDENGVSHHQVRPAISVEIRHQFGKADSATGQVTLRRLKTAVAVPQQDVPVGHDKVHFAITIEVAGSDGVWPDDGNAGPRVSHG